MTRAMFATVSVVLLTGCGASEAKNKPPCEPVTMKKVVGLEEAILLAADASSPTDVWAVGSSEHLSPSQSAIAVRWDGSQWTRSNVPGVETLYDVAVIGPDDVWAIGDAGFDEHGDSIDDWLGHWDGSRWSKAEPPPDWDLVNASSIAAVATDDVWLVGTDFGADDVNAAPYLAHWDGVRWSRFAAGVESGLLEDVSAFSADSVWAAGYESLDEFDQEAGSLVLRWDGEEWFKIATPREWAGPDNITATTHTEAWVVPDYFVEESSPLFRWDGTTWKLEVAPVFAISALSAFEGSLWVAGTDERPSERLVERFDQGWEPATVSGAANRPDGDEGFIGLVPVSERTAWGVGRGPIASRACIE
jgi:hypothetical protein